MECNRRYMYLAAVSAESEQMGKQFVSGNDVRQLYEVPERGTVRCMRI